MVSDQPKSDLSTQRNLSCSAILREHLDIEAVRGRVDDALGLRLAYGYRLALNTLERFDLLDRPIKVGVEPARVPTLTEIMDRFSPERLSHLTDYQKPTIVIKPPHKTYQDYVQAFSIYHEHGVSNGPLITSFGLRDPWSGVDYCAYIVEAAGKMSHRNDSLISSLKDRVKYRKGARRQGECGMDRILYYLLSMQSITRGRMIDENHFTVLDAEPMVVNRYIPIGQCPKGQPSIDWVLPDTVNGARGRFRRVLRGSVG